MGFVLPRFRGETRQQEMGWVFGGVEDPLGGRSVFGSNLVVAAGVEVSRIIRETCGSDFEPNTPAGLNPQCPCGAA